MSKIMLGSARKDENGKYTNGIAGDQTGKEVSMQEFYVHKKGWIVVRFKDDKYAKKSASLMKKACNNEMIGYSQSDRYGIMDLGISTKKPCNCDCSSLARRVFLEASGTDPGDFTTANAVSKMNATGLTVSFEYTDDTELKNGDFLVTKTKGHIVVVVSGGNSKAKVPVVEKAQYYPAYNGSAKMSIDVMFRAIGVPTKYTGSWTERRPVAIANGIKNYVGSAEQNTYLKSLALKGKLKTV